tara:strand:+ start:27922 stop:31848 length:3927 start_codon:yes stop_codon:yes gene_type:complete
MAISNLTRDPDLEWIDHVQPVGLVVSSGVLKEFGLSPLHQTPADTVAVADLLTSDDALPALADPWAFAEQVLGWEACHVHGAPGGPEVPHELSVRLPEHGTTLTPTWAVAELGEDREPWQLLVGIEGHGVGLDDRRQVDGWEATPHQRFERLLRETGVGAGVLISDTSIRIVYAPKGETSGHLTFPLRPLGTVAGRPMLGGLKLLLDRFRLFSDAADRRLPSLLSKSREAQASVSTELAGQVLGALHELLRGFDAAEPTMTRRLATDCPDHLYGGLLTVLMRLVFILYAEDRNLLPSLPGSRARAIYETSYSVRGLYARLLDAAALHPDTMDERRGAWGQLTALARLIHSGHKTGFIQARGGKFFDPEEYPFLEGRDQAGGECPTPQISDGAVLRVLDNLVTLKLRGQDRERLSYRTLDVEQIGSVYETIMGFTVERAPCRVLAIKAGKNNKTPVFVRLDELLSKEGKDRVKDLKENAARTLAPKQAESLEDACTVEELAAALDSIVDERGSPRHVVATAGSPILQPTDERRRTGSHYTPRSLTAPIVTHALGPAFARLGPDATPEQILDLKVCDPAMGSGAFLVEACRAIATRLVGAWARWPETRPMIPADEDEELHARRLVAQRCLYGVDRNARAVDLARLSLWLATLAKDHEFSFLDHALKCGDSLVGLTPEQIGAANWDVSKAGLPLLRPLVAERLAEADRARAEIRSAPDDTMRAIQEQRHKHVEARLSPVRLLGDAVVAAFFLADKPKAREKALAEAESWFSGRAARWDLLEDSARKLRQGGFSVSPFHWATEFPEVFRRENGGFDAIVGNPPFLGGAKIWPTFGGSYVEWLKVAHKNTGGKGVNLVAHFLRRSIDLLRDGGAFGLIATNTVAQGDTRNAGLKQICGAGCTIYRVVRKFRWPGDADVVVSVVHVAKSETAPPPRIDGQCVDAINSMLLPTQVEMEPKPLIANQGLCFRGSDTYGTGFIFTENGGPDTAGSVLEMKAIISKDPRNSERLMPFIGGRELSNDPRHLHNRYAINFADLSLDNAKNWPDLLDIVERTVKPKRDKLGGYSVAERRRDYWWQYGTYTPALFKATAHLNRVCATGAAATMHHMISVVDAHQVFSHKAIVFASENMGFFAILQSTVHESWSSTFGTTFGSSDALTYNPLRVFRTFPLPNDWERSSALKDAGRAYHEFRAKIMIAREEGLTKTYNRFHDRKQKASDIVALRRLHAELDAAVLRAYSWDDLAGNVRPDFIELDSEEGKETKTRFCWSSEFMDEVLARLLALNAKRTEAERTAGLTPTNEDVDEEQEREEHAT